MNEEFRMKNEESAPRFSKFLILNSKFFIQNLSREARDWLYSDPNAPDEQLPTLSMIIN
jgi:hypothetical protein